jgi:hypothetical protein
VPTICAKLSWLILVITASVLLSLPKCDSNSRMRPVTFAGVEKLVDQVRFITDVAGQQMREQTVLGFHGGRGASASSAAFQFSRERSRLWVVAVAIRSCWPARHPSPFTEWTRRRSSIRRTPKCWTNPAEPTLTLITLLHINFIGAARCFNLRARKVSNQFLKLRDGRSHHARTNPHRQRPPLSAPLLTSTEQL